MSDLLQDLRYGLRTLLKRPGFTVVAVLTLALGIGANAAIFSVVNSVLLNPLPYPDSERLMTIWEDHQAAGGPNTEWTSPPGFADWRDQAQSFDHVSAYGSWQPTLTGQADPEQLSGATVSHNTFSLLGVPPARGRSFLQEEDQAGAEPVVVISHELWQRRFGGDVSLIGKQISLNGTGFTVIGIMPEGFRFPVIPNAEIWRTIQPLFTPGCQRGCLTIQVLARLKPEASFEQARIELEAIAARISEQFPESNSKVGVTLVSLREFLAGPATAPLLVLLGAVGFVLLIACVNVASLLLARAAGREKEIAIRASLGAGRWRIIRQLLSESVLLALIGGVAGLMLAFWMVDILIAFAPQQMPRLDEIALDQRALGFTFIITVLTGILFGLFPALQVSGKDLNRSLRDSGKGSHAGRGNGRMLSGLVVAETALALMLLVGAGLLIRSFIQLQRVDPGFKSENLLTALIALPQTAYPDAPQVADFYDRLLERLSAQPGVQAVGAVTTLPLSGDNSDVGFLIEGRPAQPPGQRPVAWYSNVSDDYFRAMGIRLLSGRAFSERDNENAPRVVIVSEALARRYFPDEDPIGKRIGNGRPDGWREIVGLVGDVKQFGINQDARPTMYFPDRQATSPRRYVVMRSTGDPMNMAAGLRSEVASLDNDLAVSAISTMEQVRSDSISDSRFTLLLLGLFAALALLLAAAGIYGVMSYTVTRRIHEIGLRMALGAQAGDMLKMVIGKGMLLVAIGISLGLAGSIALTRLMSSLLFGVSATDPLTFIAIAVLLTLVAFAACWFPARRAAKVDPMVALRYE